MLGLFILCFGIFVGKIIYELSQYLLEKFIGDNDRNQIISFLIALSLTLCLAQFFIEYIH